MSRFFAVLDEEITQRLTEPIQMQMLGTIATAYINETKERLSILFDNGVEYEVAVLAYGEVLQKEAIARLYVEAMNRRQKKEK